MSERNISTSEIKEIVLGAALWENGVDPLNIGLVWNVISLNLSNLFASSSQNLTVDWPHQTPVFQ